MNRNLSFALAYLLFLQVFSFWGVGPNPGKHCPTAPVQTLVETIHVRDGRGGFTLKQVAYSPKPGDGAFVACACAAKEQSENREGLLSRPEPYAPLDTPALVLRFPLLPKLHAPAWSPIDALDASIAPPTPPPIS